ncbi:MAG: AMP-binding protein, partial [Spirochaetia bacterium]|nr:AMP-binding protein [Spirochaetia bacterium]
SEREISEAEACDPEPTTNILFTSGTTGDPKAIPWTHLTPIKCAADATFHMDVQERDVLCWPTSLGWMMGSWLIYASFINRATMALYEGSPNVSGFGHFVEKAGVTLLGLVPSMVKNWRQNRTMEGMDWSRIRRFASTGECSNREDYFYLMYLAGYKPVLEYCGGTELGGGYLSGTMVQPCAPGTFSTPALGADLEILNEEGAAAKMGEAFLVPPSIGYSSRLLNKNHHAVYFEGTPMKNGKPLRRHGDLLEKLGGGYFRMHGRVDDTMNLGGIKVSSAEIEECLRAVPEVTDAAAVAMNPAGGGPSLLVVYAVLAKGASAEAEAILKPMQKVIREKLNPLFKISKVVLLPSLPRTASNKILRRLLRDPAEEKAGS